MGNMTAPSKDEKNDERKDPLETTSYAHLFAWATGLLLASTLWGFWDEARGRRPWKAYQEAFGEQAAVLLETQLAAGRRSLEESEVYENLSARFRAAVQEFNESSERTAISAELTEIERHTVELRKQFMDARGAFQAAAYRMEKTTDPGARAELLSEIKGLEASSDEVSKELELLDERKKGLRARLREMQSEIEGLRGQIAELEEPVRAVERRIAGIEARKVEIHQYVNPELRLIDRCTSCHVATTMPGFEELPQPFRSHREVVSSVPRNGNGNGPRDLLGLHDVEKFGCTTCHRGQGYATTTVEKAHGSVEHWPTPMLGGKTVEAGCVKCHLHEPYLKGASILNEGRRLTAELGCFGCHNFGPYLTVDERTQQIGPDLNGLKDKVDPAWLVRWIEKPRSFRPHTPMPDFRFTRREAEGITAYLWQNPGSGVVLSEVEPFDEAHVEEGQRLFETSGCLGCHRVEDKGNPYAPDLSRIGEKAHYSYIVNWVRAPHEVKPQTEMPFLNLQPEEAVKIAAYLSTRRSEVYHELTVDLEAPQLAARGRTLITMYNCHGCHLVPGFEDVEPLVPDIYTVGSNPIERFDFGLLEEEILNRGGLDGPREDVVKARELWIRAKLEDPRCYDRGKYKKDVERLRMPDFQLSPRQIDTLTTFLLGLTGERVPEAYRRVPTEVERAIQRGRVLYQTYRCYGCHGEEGAGNVVNPNYVKGTVPALNQVARVMMLYRPTDVGAVVDEIVKGVPLESLSDRPPVRRFSAVLAKYQILRDTIRRGSEAGRADPEGPEPPYHMPSWKDVLGSREMDDLMVYFLSRYPWDQR
jgi:mono/diheme cytochrome c family protein